MTSSLAVLRLGPENKSANNSTAFYPFGRSNGWHHGDTLVNCAHDSRQTKLAADAHDGAIFANKSGA
jgi:hypothetical protein